jgi:Asp-tRNA(Asn)/Glu-tRNA(Gln) amidotransferase C subunit
MQFKEMQDLIRQSAAKEAAAHKEVEMYASKFSEIQGMVDTTTNVIAGYKTNQDKVRVHSLLNTKKSIPLMIWCDLLRTLLQLLKQLKESEADRITLLKRCTAAEKELLNMATQTKDTLTRFESQSQVMEKLKAVTRSLQTDRQQSQAELDSLRTAVRDVFPAIRTLAGPDTELKAVIVSASYNSTEASEPSAGEATGTALPSVEDAKEAITRVLKLVSVQPPSVAAPDSAPA